MLNVVPSALEEFKVTHAADDDPAAYDVCLSFAGEDREYVEGVASSLGEQDVRVFYDRHERASLWGKDLYQHLDQVYRVRARYCIIFISAAYARKLWPRHELRAAQARAFKENREYILPARFDETEIPGLPDTIGYVDLRDLAPTAFAALVLTKLGVGTASGWAPRSAAPSTTPKAATPAPSDTEAGAGLRRVALTPVTLRRRES